MTGGRPGRARRAFFPRMKLGVCPGCGKKGLGPTKWIGRPGFPGWHGRECRYCLHLVEIKD